MIVICWYVKSLLVQVMAWYHHAINHHLNKCWSRLGYHMLLLSLDNLPYEATIILNKSSQYHGFWYPLYSDIIMSMMASQITGISIVYPTICSGTDQRKHQSSASLAFVRGIHWWPVNSPHKGLVTRKIFSFDDIIMLAPQIISHQLECHWLCQLISWLIPFKRQRYIVYFLTTTLPIHCSMFVLCGIFWKWYKYGEWLGTHSIEFQSYFRHFHSR